MFSLKRRFAQGALVMLLIVGGSCARDEVTGVPGLSADRSSGSLNNVIVFTEERPFAQLAVINPDGTGRRLLTDHPEHGHLYPAISPDGRFIAFGRFRADNTAEGIFIANADGSGETLVINHSTLFDGEPTWSPDGSQLAFMTSDPGQFGPIFRIYVVNRDGTGLRRLSPLFDEQTEFFFDEGPSWSPDGTRIAFTRNAQLFLINPDGTGLTALPNEDDAIGPSWSPDGTRIAYSSLVPFGDIRIRDADGSNMVAVTNTPEYEGGPRWSADGKRMVMVRDLGGQTQLFVVNVDGTGEARLSFGTIDNQADWSRFPPLQGGLGTKVVITPTNAKLAPGETRQFTATVTTANGAVVGSPVLRWSSSDPTVAGVTASGFMTALANGTVQIRAVFGGDTARAYVRVADRVLRNTIVYATDEYGTPFTEFAAVRPDGSGRRRLTIDRFGYRSPDISPDGRAIAWVTDFGVFTIPADAAGITESFTNPFVSFDGGFPAAPAWSPDGSSIAFSAIVEGAFGRVRRILVVNTDGSGLRQVSPDDPTTDDEPSWSPDGTRLIFTRDRVLHSINADGTGLAPLPNEDGASSPDWSPDGSRVVYASATAGFGIRIRNADGSNPVTVTTHAGDSHPRWAPDNQRLVFVRVVDGRSQLFIINADGTGETRLSTATGQHTEPSWSPVP